ncbi:hypothetical protein GRI75_11045 [Altererythrobacter soli]|uniref:DUF8021 domain-containing protein n=1 Tax=Croceibacterium soli TaxID=1739690 RepID=A0A6I4UXW6_9SPHN|nr:hypothetical protein [Croceibacterium soli]MXP42177.1 hypothetical protein [Croceibacterium soli]
MANRGRLQAALDEVLDLAGNGEAAAVLGRARYTENGQELPVGEGLWSTADKLGPYCHTMLDEESGQAACFVTLTEGTSRSIAALRVSAPLGRAEEIEAVVARPALFGGAGAFGDGPDALDKSGGPDSEWLKEIHPSERMGRAELAAIADLYFAGLERNDGQGTYPFADACVRVENGFRTTNVPPDPSAGKTPYAEAFRALSAKQQFETGYFRFVDRIRDRRFPVIDPSRGMVFSLAFFDHSGTVREYDLADGTPIRSAVDRPFSWMIAEAFRIENGLITRIEALMTECPYGMRSGWPNQAL